MDEENLSQFYTHSSLKTFSSLGTEGHLFNFTENTHEKPAVDFTLNGERLNTSLILRTR